MTLSLFYLLSPTGVPAQSKAVVYVAPVEGIIDLGLAPFAAGDYAIEVAQGEARQVTAFRVVP